MAITWQLHIIIMEQSDVLAGNLPLWMVLSQLVFHEDCSSSSSGEEGCRLTLLVCHRLVAIGYRWAWKHLHLHFLFPLPTQTTNCQHPWVPCT